MLEQLPPSPQIREFWLGRWREGDDLALVRATLPRLQELSVMCYQEHRRIDLTPLRDMPDLTIRVHGATEIRGTEYFPTSAVIRFPRPRT
jgi:hypothetical protein